MEHKASLSRTLATAKALYTLILCRFADYTIRLEHAPFPFYCAPNLKYRDCVDYKRPFAVRLFIDKIRDNQAYRYVDKVCNAVKEQKNV